MKVTNSLYENILCLTFENGFKIREVFYDSRQGEQRKRGLKLFGLVSPRGDLS